MKNDMNYTIEKIEDRELKASIVKDILIGLPDYFGLPESTANYIEESKALELWAAIFNGDYIGFITLKGTSEDCGEIHCMGVKSEYHRMGIGRHLFWAMEEYAMKKYLYLQVKTVDEGHYIEYDKTVAFYKLLGFSKLEVFPTLWDEHNPCLILIKSIS